MKNTFNGFPRGKLPTFAIYTAFISDLLPLIDDLAELKVTLYFVWAVQQREGRFHYLRRRDFLNDANFMAGLAGLDFEPSATLDAALERACQRGTLLHVEIRLGGEIEPLYFVNTELGRDALEQIVRGEWVPSFTDQPVEILPERPNIYRLYEANFGTLTPMLVDTLRDAEKEFPEGWIAEAMRIAVESNARSWRFVQAVLDRWQREGKSNHEVPERRAQSDGQRYITREICRLHRTLRPTGCVRCADGRRSAADWAMCAMICRSIIRSSGSCSAAPTRPPTQLAFNNYASWAIWKPSPGRPSPIFKVDVEMLSPAQQQSLKLAYDSAQIFAAEPKGWLLLEGTYGCGKTHLAAAIANQRLEQEEAVLFITTPDLLDHLRSAYGPSSETGYDQYVRPDAQCAAGDSGRSRRRKPESLGAGKVIPAFELPLQPPTADGDHHQRRSGTARSPDSQPPAGRVDHSPGGHFRAGLPHLGTVRTATISLT